MLKRYIWLVVATVFFAFQIFIDSASALELSDSDRTVTLNEQGDTVTLTLKQAKEGRRLFGSVCAQCHPDGNTKTNPNIRLGLNDLALATPRRDNIEGLVDYMKNPTTFDGEIDISELHPATSSADIFPEMKNLTDDDLYNIAGHILVQPKIRESWGAGKSFF
ncbi:MAG: photosystem II cytochrome c-550 [Geitlerinemataceae cyanobacterium]